MKKIGLLALVIMSVGLMSCERPAVDPSVRFYVEGEELTSDTLVVPLNSYQEIGIKTVSQRSHYDFYWQLPTGYPESLVNGSDNFHLYLQSTGYNGGSNGAVLTTSAEFRMWFSDSLYHAGDVCRLRVYSTDYQRVLKVVVE